MIISKSQDQSLKEVGIDLREECLSHMGLPQKLVLQKNTYIGAHRREETNVVYKEFLCWIFIIRTYNTCILKNNYFSYFLC
jgi:hypothetical protein